MSVRRLMGIETEYAITANEANPLLHENPIELSFDLIEAAASFVPVPTARWDYRSEDPVNDARGYRLPRASARPEMLTDATQLRPTNLVASNGGRLYVDHAHPEYSSPETLNPMEALAADRIGDVMMQEAAAVASVHLGRTVKLYRNNTDGKGSSWGAHENYQVARSLDFGRLSRLMTAHFVTRQIYTGAGRVGIGEKSEISGYQISQRADYFHTRIGLQTTFDRPIINTRDESHSTSQFRRLHVIIGDANRMDVPEVLKLGTTSLLAWMAQNADAVGFDLNELLDRCTFADPVQVLHSVSHDLSLGQSYSLENGTEEMTDTTAWQVQVTLRSAVYAVGAAVYGTDSLGEPLWPDNDTAQIVALWGQALEMLARVRHENDDERLADTQASRSLEWLLKWQLLEGMRRRRKTDWSAPILSALDLSWADCDPDSSIFTKVRARTQQLVSDQDIADARTAPQNTRAWVRAMVLRRFPQDIVAASWKQITVRVGSEVKTIDISDSTRFGKDNMEIIFKQSETIAEFVEHLAGFIQ